MFLKNSKLFVFNIQKILLNFFYMFFFYEKKNYNYAVGLANDCNISGGFKDSLKKAFSVNFYSDEQFKNSFNIDISGFYFKNYIRILIGPIILAYLARKSKAFIYVQQLGFLIDDIDHRYYEFNFLKKKNIKIITCFIGNDIRSPKKTIAYFNKLKKKSMSHFDKFSYPHRLKKSYELKKKSIAVSADLFSDLIFNWPVDQLSYLLQKTHPLNYFIKDYDKKFNYKKFKKLNIVKIVHATTDSLAKGSNIIVEILKKIKNEGYKIDYQILKNTKHEDLIKILRNDAHIVIGQLYGQTPGVFAAEAMINSCAVLTSADKKIETQLQGKKTPWVIVDHINLERELKKLLVNKKLIKKLGKSNYLWAKKYHSFENSKKIIIKTFKKNQIFKIRKD
jgi:hypothetical protein